MQEVALRYISVARHNWIFANELPGKDLSVLRVTDTQGEALSLEQLDVVFGNTIDCSLS